MALETDKLLEKKKNKKDSSSNQSSYSSTSRRIPISFSADNLHVGSINDSEYSQEYTRNKAALSRYRYYNRLGMPTMPDHIVPSKFFVLIPLVSKVPGTQKSIVTIFAIWNTMMGTSLLSMPWVFQQAGFGLGLALMLLVATIAFYTVYLVLKSTASMPVDTNRVLFTPDFTDACRYYLGRPAEIVAMVFSFIGLLGALIVYYVLLCDFLYSSVTYIYDYSTNTMDISRPVTLHNRVLTDVYCPQLDNSPTSNAHHRHINHTFDSDYQLDSFHTGVVFDHPIINTTDYNGTSIFVKIWNKQQTVPFWLLIIVIPLVSIKSPNFFTKFNALGTVSIAYLAFLVIMKSIKWGINLDFSATDYPDYVPIAKVTFPILTGVGMLAFFIHNAIHSIVRNQSKPQNNIRDLFIAYVCVAITYVGVGLLFYAAFPFAKDCLQQNFLANLTTSDIYAFIARIALFLQMMTVYPLLMYILRSQFMYFFFKKFYPSWLHVMILHLVLLGFCIFFAVFMPHIGEIIRFSGALCGLVYMLALPCLVKIKMIHMAKSTYSSSPALLSYSSPSDNNNWSASKTFLNIAFHYFLIFLGLMNFIGQFLPFFLKTSS